jgi:hypothetical protein
MEGESRENVGYDFDDVHQEVHAEMVVCSNCQQRVPKGVYCPHCGYPQYLENPVSFKTDTRGEFDHEITTDSIDTDKNEEQMVETASKDKGLEPAIQISSIEKLDSDESSGESKKDEKTSFFSSVRKFMGIKGSHSRADEINDNEIREIPKEENDLQVEKETEFPLEEVVKEEEFEIVKEVNKDSEEFGDFEVQEMNIDILDSGIVDTEVEVCEDHMSLYEPDPKLVEMQHGFLQSISMKLWLINMLQERGMEEEQFNKMFDNYEALFSCFSSRREKILSQLKDVSSLETSLGKAKVYFEELKMKKTIGKVTEEEYEVKTKALEWDIKYYEEEISRRNKDVEFLMDLPRVMSVEEVNKLKSMAERCRWAMDNFESSNKISSGSAIKVRESLHNTLDILEAFQTFRSP